MNYYNNKKFGLLQFYSGYGKFYLKSPKGYSRKIINAQTAHTPSVTLEHAPHTVSHTRTCRTPSVTLEHASHTHSQTH